MNHLGTAISCFLLASVPISAKQPMPAGQRSPISASAHSQEASTGKQDRHVMAFGENGQIKMLYDRRQRPQSVFLNGAVYIVFNGGAEAGAEGRSPTRPMIVEYDPVTREFSNALMLGSGSRDHHYGPVIWADPDDYLHVLFGCHRTPGTHVVTNSEGEKMVTPVDLEQANSRCRIWDTEWRGAGVPPTIALDELGNPAFLHVLSEDTLEKHRYYFVRKTEGQWSKDPVAPSNHQWNSGHLSRSAEGTWYAYLITGKGYLDTGGYMDSYGGGSIEEWVSLNEGKTWRKERELTPDVSEYPGWKYNNVQPVMNPDGSVVEGMLLFYGWNHRDNPLARAFLIHGSSPN